MLRGIFCLPNDSSTVSTHSKDNDKIYHRDYFFKETVLFLSQLAQSGGGALFCGKRLGAQKSSRPHVTCPTHIGFAVFSRRLSVSGFHCCLQRSLCSCIAIFSLFVRLPFQANMKSYLLSDVDKPWPPVVVQMPSSGAYFLYGKQLCSFLM
jgi:hypothetical protein